MLRFLSLKIIYSFMLEFCLGNLKYIWIDGVFLCVIWNMFKFYDVFLCKKGFKFCYMKDKEMRNKI